MPRRPGSPSTTRPDDDEILTFEQWCVLNKLSPRTGWRVLHGPDGPTMTRLSARRIGITRGNDGKWKRSREIKRIAARQRA
jgi:hypothetical protein